ncbi:MAG TPA: alpha/beta hydrolase [Burkholderiales bacterium]|nr:alpha/beta hydrolase [Burkholderiales bacterium]
MDSKRRALLGTGAAAAAIAATGGAFGASEAKPGGSFYRRGDVRIHYQDVGSGVPLLIIPGGGQNSNIGWVTTNAPFDATAELRGEYRCITADLRNAPSGQSTGPLEIDRTWDSYTDDQLGLMDHLGIRRFMVLGYCIGGPFIWNLVKRAPDRIIAAVVSQPVGFRKETPRLAYDNYMKTWAPALTKQRPEITTDAVSRFLVSMYEGPRGDFVHSVERDVVRACKVPALIMPDDSPPHPYVIAKECIMLAPKSEASIYPWKDPKERVPVAVRQVRSFLKAHRASA